MPQNVSLVANVIYKTLVSVHIDVGLSQDCCLKAG